MSALSDASSLEGMVITEPRSGRRYYIHQGRRCWLEQPPATVLLCLQEDAASLAYAQKRRARLGLMP